MKIAASEMPGSPPSGVTELGPHPKVHLPTHMCTEQANIKQEDQLLKGCSQVWETIATAVLEFCGSRNDAPLPSELE